MHSNDVCVCVCLVLHAVRCSHTCCYGQKAYPFPEFRRLIIIILQQVGGGAQRGRYGRDDARGARRYGGVTGGGGDLNQPEPPRTRVVECIKKQQKRERLVSKGLHTFTHTHRGRFVQTGKGENQYLSFRRKGSLNDSAGRLDCCAGSTF